LQAGAIGLLGLGADHVAALQAAGRPNASHVPKARSVIYIFLSGGLSQIDSFDPKPDAPADIRDEFGGMATQSTGLRICEHLPLLAQRSRRRPSSSQETKFSTASGKCQVPSRLTPSKKLWPNRRFFRCLRGTFSPSFRHSWYTRLRLTCQPSRRSNTLMRRQPQRGCCRTRQHSPYQPLFFCGGFGCLSLRRAGLPQDTAGATLRHAEGLLELTHGLATLLGRHHFFWATSWSIWLSRANSATRRFRRAFSACSSLRRLASSALSPP
jgi:hypothetical protein